MPSLANIIVIWEVESAFLHVSIFVFRLHKGGGVSIIHKKKGGSLLHYLLFLSFY